METYWYCPTRNTLTSHHTTILLLAPCRKFHLLRDPRNEIFEIFSLVAPWPPLGSTRALYGEYAQFAESNDTVKSHALGSYTAETRTSCLRAPAPHDHARDGEDRDARNSTYYIIMDVWHTVLNKSV